MVNEPRLLDWLQRWRGWVTAPMRATRWGVSSAPAGDGSPACIPPLRPTPPGASGVPEALEAPGASGPAAVRRLLLVASCRLLP